MKEGNKSEKTPIIEESQELGINSQSRELESALYCVQQKINELASDSDSTNELNELQERKVAMLKLISRKAKEMMKEDQYTDFAANMERGIAGEFDKIYSQIPAGENKGVLMQQAVSQLINFLKLRVGTYIDEVGVLDQDQKEEVLSAMDNYATSEREEFIKRLNLALQPIVKAQKENPKAAEMAQRKSFLRSRVDKTPFIPIEDTDGILAYGISWNTIHLHLAPMRTLSPAEKLDFVKNTLPNAFKKLAAIVKLDDKIKSVSATSYVVAAMPDLFQRYGFNIEALDEESRNNSWGAENRPVLKAKITRDGFLELYDK